MYRMRRKHHIYGLDKGYDEGKWFHIRFGFPVFGFIIMVATGNILICRNMKMLLYKFK